MDRLSLTRGAALAAAAAVPIGIGAQTLEKIRVLGPPNDGFKAVYYGIESGLFKRIGIAVEPSLVSSGAAGSAAVIGGAAEVVYTNILTLIQAHAREVPLVFIAPGALMLAGNSPTFTLVRKDSALRSGRDLNGKVVGAPALRDVNAVAMLAWIDKTGGDSKTVRVIEVPTAVGAAALVEGRVEAVTMNEPFVSQALADGKVRVLAKPYEAVGNKIMTAGFAAMATLIDRNADVMGRFARGMHEAAAYTNTHLSETVPLVARYSGAAPDVIAKSTRMVDAEYLEPANLQPLVDLSAKYGLIERVFPATEIISPAAVKAAKP